MRTRIVVRHDPASVIGLIGHRRGRPRTFRGLARAIARRVNEARARAAGRIA